MLALSLWDMRSGRSRASGFSLIELLLVLAILSILLAIATPSYRASKANEQILSASESLLAALNLARNESVKRATTVTIKPASGGWSNGWSVGAGSVTVLSHPALAGVAVTGPNAGVTYSRDGRAIKSSFTLSSVQTGAAPNRYVCISIGGKPRSQKGACP